LVWCSAQAADASARWVDSLSRQLNRAVTTGDVSALRASAALADKLLQAFPNDGLLQHYRGYAAYRLSVMLPEQGDAAGAEQQAEQAMTWLNRSTTTRPLAESHAIMASLIGKAIASGKLDGMAGGQAIAQAEGAAMALGAGNPRVLLLKGISAWYTPEEYGGGHTAGRALVNRAIDAFANDKPAVGLPAWGHAEAYTWLGLMALEEGDKAAARAALRKALEIEPDYGWAKQLLATDRG
jgi:tetratricopeptide (TPR) repeat protein